MQYKEDYVLGVLQEGGLLTRKQIEGARSRLNGEPGVLDVLIDDGSLSEVDVSRTLAQLRPWSLMVVMANTDEYIGDMMVALRV